MTSEVILLFSWLAFGTNKDGDGDRSHLHAKKVRMHMNCIILVVCAWRLFSLSPAQRTVFLQIRKNMVGSIKYKESALYSYRNPQRKRHAVMSQIIWQLWSVRSIVYIRKVVTASAVC